MKCLAPLLLLPFLAAISPFILQAPSPAQGTWIEVHRGIKDPRPGTLGEAFCRQDRWCGEVVYVDASSIIRRGDYAYYNWAIDFIDKNGIKADPGKPLKPIGVEANCRARTVKTRKNGWVSWSVAGEWESFAAKFACR